MLIIEEQIKTKISEKVKKIGNDFKVEKKKKKRMYIVVSCLNKLKNLNCFLYVRVVRNVNLFFVELLPCFPCSSVFQSRKKKKTRIHHLWRLLQLYLYQRQVLFCSVINQTAVSQQISWTVKQKNEEELNNQV